MKKDYEKRLVVNWNNQVYDFKIQPVEINDEIVYNINLFDGWGMTIERQMVNGGCYKLLYH